MMPDDTKLYLDYLDKEMTIMGVLSAFSVAVPSLVLSQVAGAKESSGLEKMWAAHPNLFAAGSAFLLLSALCFYRQRSLLAYYYGQICLALVPNFAEQSRDEWLTEADSWATWLHYRWAFGFMVLGFVVYGLAYDTSGEVVTPNRMPGVLIACIAVTLAAGVVQSVVLTRPRLKYSLRPWTLAWRYLRRHPTSLCRLSKRLQPTSGAAGPSRF
jgi:hypothetical protein